MKKLHIFIAFFLITLSINAITITSYTFDKNSYAPGDSGELKLQISLDHAVSSSETLIGFRNVGIEVSSNFATQKSFYLGDSTQTTLYLSIPLKIDENTAPGTYAIPVKIWGYADISTSGGTKSELDTSQTTAVIKVVEPPKFSASIKPSLLGEKQNVVLTICNNGGKAKNVEVSLSGDFLFSEGTLYYGEIDKEKCVEKEASIETFSEGKLSMELSISYKNSIGEESSTTISLPVTVDRGSTTLILSHKNEIYSGKESEMTFEIKNKGKDAEEIRIRPSSEINFVGDSEVLIQKLTKYSSLKKKKKVYTELSPGVHDVPFIIRWKEEGEEQSETINVPVKVVAKDGIDVYLEAEPLPLEVNKEATISVVVANKANFDISSVSVSISSDAFDILEISNKKFIGSLQPDDFSSEQFKVLLKESGNRNVSVVVEYKDPSGKITSKPFVIPVKINSPSSKNPDLTYIIIVIIIAVIVVAYYYFKVKREKK